MSTLALSVEFPWFSRCPNHERARALLDAVLAERVVEGASAARQVEDDATARRTRFPGSPTIRMAGRDVEPGFRDDGDYAPRCRLHATAEGLSGVPERAVDEAGAAARPPAGAG